MKIVLRFGMVLLMVAAWSWQGAYSQTNVNLVQTAPSPADNHFGLLSDPAGVVPDSKCAECHPNHVRLMHRGLTNVGIGKTQAITQGMVNLAVECEPDGKGSFTCRPRPEAKCFHCHAVSITGETLSLIDLEKMKAQKSKGEILGHACLTCHRPKGKKNHHLTGNMMAITIRASKTFRQACGGCHAEGLAKITSGGSPHDWLARHLDSVTGKEEGVGP